jgi:hypothetical protein
VECSCEHAEPSGSLKCWEVPEWLHNWRFLRKGSAPLVSKLHFMRVRKIGGTRMAVNQRTFLNFFDVNGSESHQLGTGLTHRA